MKMVDINVCQADECACDIHIIYVRVTEIELVMYLQMIPLPQAVAVNTFQGSFRISLAMYV